MNFFQQLKYDWKMLSPGERMAIRLGLLFCSILILAAFTEILVHAN